MFGVFVFVWLSSFLKYSIVFTIPSISFTRGCQLNPSRAFEMSGLRRCGSSWQWGKLEWEFDLNTNLSRCFVDDVWVGLGLADNQLGKFANRLLVWIANVYRRGDVFQILLISKSLSHLLDCISPIKPSTRSSTYWNERVCEPLP